MTYHRYIGDTDAVQRHRGGQLCAIADDARHRRRSSTCTAQNFNSNAGNTVYTFSTTTGEMFIDGVGQGTPQANRIFRTIWDGNGVDTYELSRLTTRPTSRSTWRPAAGRCSTPISLRA